MRHPILSLALAALLAGPALAGPEGAAEAPGFPTSLDLDGRQLVLLGFGQARPASSSAGSSEYAMSLYVDEEDARRAFPSLAARAGGKARQKLLAADHAQTFVMWGHFTKVAVLRAASGKAAPLALAPLVKEAVEGELSERASPELRDGARALVGLFERALKPGEEWVLSTRDDGRVELDRAGDKVKVVSAPKLLRALWGLWLGPKATSPELRRALVDRVDLLGK